MIDDRPTLIFPEKRIIKREYFFCGGQLGRGESRERKEKRGRMTHVGIRWRYQKGKKKGDKMDHFSLFAFVGSLSEAKDQRFRELIKVTHFLICPLFYSKDGFFFFFWRTGFSELISVAYQLFYELKPRHGIFTRKAVKVTTGSIACGGPTQQFP